MFSLAILFVFVYIIPFFQYSEEINNNLSLLANASVGEGEKLSSSTDCRFSYSTPFNFRGASATFYDWDTGCEDFEGSVVGFAEASNYPQIYVLRGLPPSLSKMTLLHEYSHVTNCGKNETCAYEYMTNFGEYLKTFTEYPYL